MDPNFVNFLALALLLILLNRFLNRRNDKLLGPNPSETMTGDFHQAGAAERACSYYPNKCLLSPTERCFFDQLRRALPEGYLACPKVRMADLFWFKPNQKKNGDFNRVCSKHIDCVIVDSHYHIVCCIELDDESHERKDRQERDRFVDAALSSAGIQIFRFKVQKHYDFSHLSMQLSCAA